MIPDDFKFSEYERENLVKIINMYAKMVEDHPNLPPEVYELVYESIFKDELGMSDVTDEDIDKFLYDKRENVEVTNELGIPIDNITQEDVGKIVWDEEKEHLSITSRTDMLSGITRDNMLFSEYVINDSDHYEVEMVENPLEAPSTLEDLEKDIQLASERENWILVDELLDKREEMLNKS